MKILPLIAGCLATALAATAASAADNHSTAMGHSHAADHKPAETAASAPKEPGQAAFAAIAEIVDILRSDPETDWSKVDIAALRRHLIDMDAVTLRADVSSRPVPGGAAFDVTADAPDVVGAIRRMVPAHAQTMTGAEGMTMTAEEIDGGARLTVTGAETGMIRGLGFIGIMTIGMHHQAHHLAVAGGEAPHH
ncbi:hypothetical protein [Caenispirillum salinarum]|uniref:hypothetical protein n=1 Tax=Caenispirillum salinarum TaxID=859058 RepID=UPI00384CBCF9